MNSISIAMATYNGENYIAEQLDSLRRQEILPKELVISDDCSTDNTLAIARAFSERAPFEVAIIENHERVGFTLNFQRAIKRCRGDLVFICDQDDVWFLDKLRTVSKIFDEDDHAMVVINGQIITDEFLMHTNVTAFENQRRIGVGVDRIAPGCATAFRRTWSELLFPMPAENVLYSDYDRWLNEPAALLGVRRVIPTPLQYWRRHGTTTTAGLAHMPSRIRTLHFMHELFSTRVSVAPIDSWIQRRKVLELYLTWMNDNEGRLRAVGVRSTATAQSKVHDEIQNIDLRIQATQLPVWRRSPIIFRMLRSGGYCYFRGWKSALRDLTRPTLVRVLEK